MLTTAWKAFCHAVQGRTELYMSKQTSSLESQSKMDHVWSRRSAYMNCFRLPLSLSDLDLSFVTN